MTILRNLSYSILDFRDSCGLKHGNPLTNCKRRNTKDEFFNAEQNSEKFYDYWCKKILFTVFHVILKLLAKNKSVTLEIVLRTLKNVLQIAFLYLFSINCLIFFDWSLLSLNQKWKNHFTDLIIYNKVFFVYLLTFNR